MRIGFLSHTNYTSVVTEASSHHVGEWRADIFIVTEREGDGLVGAQNANQMDTWLR